MYSASLKADNNPGPSGPAMEQKTMIGTTLDRFWTYLESKDLAHVYNAAFGSGAARQAFFLDVDSTEWLNSMPCGRLTGAEVMQMKEARDGWANPVVAADNVNHPAHYTSHPSGVEVIRITEHMGFCLGNAVKYIMRCDEKGAAVEDLKKAVWYLEREIAKREVLCSKTEELLMRPDL